MISVPFESSLIERRLPISDHWNIGYTNHAYDFMLVKLCGKNAKHAKNEAPQMVEC